MTNKKYQAGRRFEYEVKEYLENKGYIVLRTSGSHGFADLVAIGHGDVLFIQCKYGTKPSKKEVDKIYDIQYNRLDCSLINIFCMFAFRKPREKLRFIEISYGTKEERRVKI